MISWLIFAMLAPASPPSGLTIRPGDAIIFRVEEGRPVPVRKGEGPGPGELSAKLSVDHGRTFLHVMNNTSQWLNYRATMTLPGGRTVHTSVCTLMSNNRGGVEFWPQRLKAVTISDFSPAPEDGISCR